MPYIKSNDGRREALQRGEPALTAGELNYQLFYFIKHNYNENSNYKWAIIDNYVIRFLGEKPNYQKYNDMTGALVRCSKEIFRRLDNLEDSVLLTEIMQSFDILIDKYEDIKIEENGDVE